MPPESHAADQGRRAAADRAGQRTAAHGNYAEQRHCHSIEGSESFFQGACRGCRLWRGQETISGTREFAFVRLEEMFGAPDG
jgi:hypothetical protein